MDKHREILKSSSNLMDFITNVGWTHKIQITQSDIYSNNFKCLKFCQDFLSAVTIIGVLSIIPFDKILFKLLSGLVSAVSLFLTLYLNGQNYEKRISAVG